MTSICELTFSIICTWKCTTERFLSCGNVFFLFSLLWILQEDSKRFMSLGFIEHHPASPLRKQSLLQRTIVPECLMYHCIFRALYCNPPFFFPFCSRIPICVCVCVCPSVSLWMWCVSCAFKDHIRHNERFIIIVLLGILIIHSAYFLPLHHLLPQLAVDYMWIKACDLLYLPSI